jgi:hypothetical protein
MSDTNDEPEPMLQYVSRADVASFLGPAVLRVKFMIYQCKSGLSFIQISFFVSMSQNLSRSLADGA